MVEAWCVSRAGWIGDIGSVSDNVLEIAVEGAIAQCSNVVSS